MTDHGYFPPVEQYRARRTKDCYPAPLLPTPSTRGTFAPVSGTDEASMSDESALAQPCSCPTSDACILETFALLQGSLHLLSDLSETQELGSSDFQTTLAQPCHQLTTIITDLLRIPEKLQAPESATSTSLLLRRDSHLPTPGHADLCTAVRQRLDEALLDPIDVFAPIQHDIHVLLTIMGFGSVEYRAHLRHRKLVRASDETDLMCQAYDHLVRSSPKVYRSQLGERVEALQAAVEETVQQLALEIDARSPLSSGEVVESVASAKRFSLTTAKLISIPRLTACV